MFNVRSERAVIVAVLAVASQALSSFAGETVLTSRFPPNGRIVFSLNVQLDGKLYK